MQTTTHNAPIPETPDRPEPTKPRDGSTPDAASPKPEFTIRQGLKKEHNPAVKPKS